MSSTTRKDSTTNQRQAAQAAQAAAWKRSEATMLHYLRMSVFFSAIITTTSTAGWAVANIAVPAVAVFIN